MAHLFIRHKKQNDYMELLDLEEFIEYLENTAEFLKQFHEEAPRKYMIMTWRDDDDPVDSLNDMTRLPEEDQRLMRSLLALYEADHAVPQS